MKNDDLLWKGILEDLFVHFLRFFFKETDELFDIEKGFEFLDKELDVISKNGELEYPKFVDKLVKVFTKAGGEQWVLIHVEVQGYSDNNFEERIYIYNYRIFDRYRKRIAAVVILTDTNKNYHPKEYHSSFLGTETIFRFNTYKVLDQDEALLNSSNNPFSFVILTVLLELKKQTKMTDEVELLQLKIDLAKRLLDQQFPKTIIRGIYDFIRNYVDFEDKENDRKFDFIIESTTNKNKTMGIVEMLKAEERKTILEEGREEGREEGKAKAVKNLILKMGLSDEQAAEIIEVSLDFVKKIREQLKK